MMPAQVALCEEGVDRNDNKYADVKQIEVALCEEGVDRNDKYMSGLHDMPRRPLRRGRG